LKAGGDGGKLLYILIAAGLNECAAQDAALQWCASAVLDARNGHSREGTVRWPAGYLRVDGEMLRGALAVALRAYDEWPGAVLVLADGETMEQVEIEARAACDGKARIIIEQPLLARINAKAAVPLTCEECRDLADAAVSYLLADSPLEQSMPGVARQLAGCGECRQEIESLVRVLRSARGMEI
jgi:hypothetical protein